MRRINQVLRRLERDRVWHQMHFFGSGSAKLARLAKFDEQIAEAQARYDRLAGVAERTS